MKKVGALLLSMLFVLCAIPAFGAAEAPQTEFYQVGGGWTGERFSASWFDTCSTFKCAIFDRLIMLNPDGSPGEPELAKEYSLSEDGLTYTFVLNEGITWHDGVPFTAEDVVWSVKTALKSANIYEPVLNSFKKIIGGQDYYDGKADEISGITVSGDTIIFQMEEPCSTFFFAVAMWPPYPKHLLEDEDPATLHLCSFWDKPIGTGPYMLTEVSPNNYAIAEAYPGYYGDAPGMPKIKFDLRSGLTTQQLVASGEIDEVYTNSPDVIRFMEDYPQYEKHEVSALYMRFLRFNVNDRPNVAHEDMRFQNVVAREAIQYAIDMATIVESFYPENGAIMDTAVPTNLAYYDPDAQKHPFDTEKAIALLNEAEFDFSRPVVLAYYYDDPVTADLMEAVKYYLELTGMQVELYFLQGDLLELIYTSRDYDILYAAIVGSLPEEIYADYLPGAAIVNDVFYYDDTYAELYSNLTTSASEQERIEAMYALQRYEQETYPQVSMFSLSYMAYYNTDHVTPPDSFEAGMSTSNYNRQWPLWSLK